MRADRYRLQGNEAGDAGDDRDNDDNEAAQLIEEEHPVAVVRRRRSAFETHRKRIVVGNMEREQAFSWQYFFISLFSYGLMLSDVFRTGLGIKSLSKYRTLEADTYIYFGPYAYLTSHYSVENATADAVKFWPYKYDTTSIPMRAVAEYLQLDAWSPCIHYKETCDEATFLTKEKVFHMVDTFVEAMEQHKGPQYMRGLGSRGRGYLTLRSDVEYKDRVYHYALPWFFAPTIKRTSQAIHYKYNASRSPPAPPLCRESISARRPYSCDQSWTNLQRIECSGTGPCPYAAATVWDLIQLREAFLAAFYPNHTIDFVVLDGMEDFMRSGMAYQGRKYYEIIVFTRIRKCENDGSCRTVAVDDYRYEAATFIMNAPAWYFFVGSLRAVGQLYAWSRLIMLVVGSYIARTREQRFRDATLFARIVVTIRTVFLVPSQVVIYGSSFPVTLYMLAHLIDSPAEYELTFAYFMSTLGQMQWNIQDLIRHCAISMRCVWIVGFMCHRIVALTTSSSWSPTHGIPGSSEFSITFIASITVFAQVRSLSFRRTKVLESQEVIASAVRYPRLAEIQDMTHMTINRLLGGTTVDAQCLLTGFLGLFCITMFIWVLNRLAPQLLPVHLTLTSTTIAPYSAGTLWPRDRLVVTWYGNVMNVERAGHGRRHCIQRGSTHQAQPVKAPRPLSEKRESFTQGRQAAIESFKQVYKQFVGLPDKALVMRDTTVSQLLQRNMHSIDKRTREIESTVFLINLAAMTDPFTFFDLRISGGRFVALYVSKRTRRCFLLPFGLMTTDADIPIDWADQELVAVVNTKELEWHNLLRCG